MAEAHVRVDLLVNRLRPRMQLVLNTITAGLSIVVGGVLTWQTWRLLMRTYHFDLHSETLLEIYLVPIYVVMPIGCFLLFLQLIINLFKQLRKEKEPHSHLRTGVVLVRMNGQPVRTHLGVTPSKS